MRYSTGCKGKNEPSNILYYAREAIVLELPCMTVSVASVNTLKKSHMYLVVKA